jgi:TonB-linked SusC/RagA family outer membrane protein
MDRNIILSVAENKSIVPQQSPGKTVSGKVTDANGEAIIGANITIKGSTDGTITDIDGNFLLRVADKAVLQVSYIGYITQEISVANQTSLQIILKEDVLGLEEVIVIGYGTQKKVNMTGAVNTINSGQIDGKPVTSLVSALTGEATGVTVMQRSGQPGGTDQQAIRIRGVGTWGSAEPLVLVDGVSMSINDVIPSEVESVSILKDAASASIYGSRAANGVILITTKQGKKGDMQLNYYGNVGFQTPTRIPKMVNSWQYAEMYNEGMANEGRVSDLFPQERIDRMKAGGDPDRLEGYTDWYKEVLNYTAPQHIHQISASGGTDKLTYMGLLGYSDQQGVIPSTSYKRYNARINSKAQLTPWLNIGFNINYLNSKREEPAGGARAAFYYLAKALPYIPVKFSNDVWGFHTIMSNPIRRTNGDYGMNNVMNNAVMLQISPEITLMKGLVVKGVFGYEANMTLDKTFNKIVEYEAFELANQPSLIDVARNKQADSWSINRNMTANATATYEFNLGQNAFKIMAGASAESFNYAYTLASRQDFPNNDFTEINGGDPNTAGAEGNSTYHALASVFGRLNYDYMNKYLFEANFRYDGSSRFARGKRYGLFPSFSAGWRISEESFFGGLRPVVPYLKVRGSWGKLGNQQISDYQYLSTFGASGAYLFNGAINSGYTETLMGNPMITWETATNINLGIDFALFDNKLNVALDWYKKNTDNILLQLQAPATLGISPSTQNAGSVQNTGWETTLSWNDKIGKDFNYHVGVNLSDVKNEIIDLRGYKSPTSTLTTRIEGYPIDALFGYETVGICMTQDDYEKYKDLMHTFNGNWALGDLILKDRDGNGSIGSEDKKVIGNQIPRYTFGINFGFDYKNFDFSCSFQGVGKADGYVTNVMVKPLNNISARIDHYEKSFHPSNPNYDAIFPRLHASWEFNYENYQSYWIQDASYIRLKNVQLGYNFKLPQLGIDRVRMSLSGENLFTLTKFMAWDPETAVGSSNMYPIVAIYSFGVNVTF